MDPKRVKEWHPALLDDKGINLESVRIADVGVDTRYQRPLRETKISTMWKAFDPAELTAIVVSRRADGSLWVLDGQHRLELLSRLGKSVVLADVREELTLEQEAHLFYRLNEGQTPVGVWDKFRARVTAREATALRIAAIVEGHGYFLAGRSKGEGAITAIAAVETLYNMGKLSKTLSIISTVWPHDAASRESNVLRGMGAFLLTWDTTEGFDDGRILEALDKISPTQIMRRAKEIQIETGRSDQGGATFALAIRDAYNGKMVRGAKPKHQLAGLPIIRWDKNQKSRQPG